MRVTVNLVLILAAMVFAVFLLLAGFGWWDWAAEYWAGWLGLSLLCGWGSFVPWGARTSGP